MKIGVFGGTFNPPHNTHVNMALQAKQQLGLDKLLVIPCGQPPHKSCQIDKNTRLQLTKLAFDGVGEILDYEINKQGNSYTVDTLTYLKGIYPNDQLYFIIGGDSIRDFDKWYRPQQIAQLATLAVVGRGRQVSSATLKKVQKLGAKVQLVNTKPNSVSSSLVRLRYQFGMDNGNLVPQKVNKYVLENGLYCKYLPMVNKLRSYLTPQRFQHTFYVVKRGLQLCTDNEFDKVFVACLLHDCAKYVTPDNYSKYDFEKPSDMPSNVVHAFLGEIVAKRDFGITDDEILQAIRYHCTAKANMSRLQMIVYVADKTEETRKYPLSHLLKGSLQSMFKRCLAEASQYCGQAHATEIYPLTQQAVDYYLTKK